MTAERSVLAEAEEIINGQRRVDYGDVLPSFTTIGKLWAPVLGVDVSAEQVALCMIGLKIARAMNGFHRDNLVDIAGYAGCLEKIADERNAARPSILECSVCGCHKDCVAGCQMTYNGTTIVCTRCTESVR